MKHELSPLDPFRGLKKGALPHEPCRSAKEVAAMFGFANVKSLAAGVFQKHFPDPDLVVPSSNSTGKKLYWKLSTLHAEARRRDASNDSKMLKGNVK